MSNKLLKTIITQDLKTAILSIEAGDLNFVRILGNRIGSNLLFFENKQLMIMCYILREISSELEKIRLIHKKTYTRSDAIVSIATDFIQKLVESIENNTIEAKRIWECYFEYKENIRGYLVQEIELKNYRNAIGFTKLISEKLLIHLKENKILLSKKNNKLILGINNELSRIINLHGFNKKDLVFYMLLQVFSSYYDYALYEGIKEKTLESGEFFKDKVENYVDRIIDLVDNYEDDFPNEYYIKICELIGEICNDWRLYYINYMELIRVSYGPPPSKEEVLTEEAKQKISETIIHALEKDMN